LLEELEPKTMLAAPMIVTNKPILQKNTSHSNNSYVAMVV
jgi:hypothetical protein